MIELGHYHLVGRWTLDHQEKLKEWLKDYQKINVYRDIEDHSSGCGLGCGWEAPFNSTIRAVMSGCLELFYYRGPFEDLGLKTLS